MFFCGKKKFFFSFFFVLLIVIFFKLNSVKIAQAIATLPDIDVTYIERTPRYNRYRTGYTSNRAPYLLPIPGDPDQNPLNDQRWPNPGEKVTFTAHFINKGTSSNQSVEYKWLVDGTVISFGVASPLGSKREGTATFEWTWPNDLNDHQIQFVADFNNRIRESAEQNNQLTEYTNSLSYSIFIEQSLYDIFERTQNRLGTYSFEDWVQGQFTDLKNMFANVRYPLVPDGIKERVRIDKITIIPFDQNNINNWESYLENDPLKWKNDSQWHFLSDAQTLAQKRIDWQKYVNDNIAKTDYGLLHELVHQLGMIDDYRFNIANDPQHNFRIFVLDRDGYPVTLFQRNECEGLMGHESTMSNGACQPFQVEDHIAIPLKLYLHQRRGFYGEYLFDIPLRNQLLFVDKNGNPMSGMSISLYQKNPSNEAFDNIPEHRGTTNADGIFVLANKQVEEAEVLGHILRANPFGQIEPVGTNGVFLVKINNNDYEEFLWLTIRKFNLAYWQGQTELATITINTNFDPNAPAPTHRPTPTTNPRITPTINPENTPTLPPDYCPRGEFGNLDCSIDGQITIHDRDTLIYYWSPTGPLPQYASQQHSPDLNHDGKVDELDLNMLYSHWNGDETGP